MNFAKKPKTITQIKSQFFYAKKHKNLFAIKSQVQRVVLRKAWNDNPTDLETPRQTNETKGFFLENCKKIVKKGRNP